MSEVSTVNNAYVAGAIDALADIATWLAAGAGRGLAATNYTADAHALRAQAAKLKAAMRDRLFNKSIGAFADGLGINHFAVHGSIWSAAFGVVTDEATDAAAIEAMAADVTAFLAQSQQKRLKCSCMGAFWLLQGLYTMGVHHAPAADLALQYLVARSPTSWLTMMETWNATTTMEAWSPSDKPNLSFSHPWCAAPNSVAIKHVLGVRPTAPRWRHFQVWPQPASVASMAATLPTPAGTVAASVTQDATAGVSLALTVPPGTQATVCLPALHASLRGGAAPPSASTSLLVDGHSVTAAPNGRLLCAPDPLAAGQHTVVRTA